MITLMVQIDISYEGDLHCSATHVPSNSILTTDAPVDNHGKGETFSPTDLVATALGTCIATTLDIYNRRTRPDLSLVGLKITVQKEMSTTAPRKIARLSTEIWFPFSKTTDPERILERVALSCPVHNSLCEKVDKPIVFHYRDETSS